MIVTTGSAALGEAGNDMAKSLLYSSLPSRSRTVAWATIFTPASPKAALPPAWSKCQWVSTSVIGPSALPFRTIASKASPARG